MEKRFKVWVVHTHERSEGSTIKTVCLTPEEAGVRAAQIKNDEKISSPDEISIDEVWVESEYD